VPLANVLWLEGSGHFVPSSSAGNGGVTEEMNRGLAVIASDAVGAAAGGLVRDGANGLVVPAGDSAALASAIRRLAGDPPLRARLGRTGEQDVLAYSHNAWAEGFSGALATLDLSRGGAGSVRRSK